MENPGPAHPQSYDKPGRIAKGRFTIGQWKDLCNQYDNKCAHCKEKRKLTADHIIPMRYGGRSVIENIQPLCQSCNSRKSTKRNETAERQDH